MVIVHVAPLGASQPVQPLNSDPAPAVAVSVTGVPGAYDAKQSAPQAIPIPVTAPKPVPPFRIVRPRFPGGTSSSLIVATPRSSAIVAFVGSDSSTKKTSVGPSAVSPTTGTL